MTISLLEYCILIGSYRSCHHIFPPKFEFCPSHMLCWRCGSMLVSHERGGWDSNPFAVMTIFFVTEFTENIKENSIVLFTIFPLAWICIWIHVQIVSRMVTVPILVTDLCPRDPNPNPSPLVEMSHMYRGHPGQKPLPPLN